MIAFLCAFIGAGVGAVVLAILLGWAGEVPLAKRIGLVMLLGGMIWAAPVRYFAGGIGAGDLMFLSGILTSLLAQHGRDLIDRAQRIE